MIWWISCSDSSNRAQEKKPASVIARVQQVVLFNIRSCAHYENISWHRKYAVALLQERIFVDETKKYPPHGKWRIPIFRHHCLNSPLILSWLYLGINRNLYKCIPYDLRKKLAEAGTFLHITQFCMKNPAKNEGGQNKWSGGCPSRRRKQKWHDGEKTFINARMVGGKDDTSKRVHRKAKFSGATFTVRSTQRSNGC